MQAVVVQAVRDYWGMRMLKRYRPITAVDILGSERIKEMSLSEVRERMEKLAANGYLKKHDVVNGEQRYMPTAKGFLEREMSKA